MDTVVRTSKAVVVDNCFDKELFKYMCGDILKETLSINNTIAVWNQVWRIDGTLPVSSPAYYRSKNQITNPAMDLCAKLFEHLTTAYPSLIPKMGAELRLHTQVNERGTKLRLHYDHHSLGSFTFYCHPEWEHGWGGDLIVPEVDAKPERKESEAETDLEDYCSLGCSMLISPKPNRCVLLAPGVVHATTRIDPDAGGAARVTVVGFLLKEKG